MLFWTCHERAGWILSSSVCQSCSRNPAAEIPVRHVSIHTSKPHTLHPDWDDQNKLFNPSTAYPLHFMKYMHLACITRKEKKHRQPNTFCAKTILEWILYGERYDSHKQLASNPKWSFFFSFFPFSFLTDSNGTPLIIGVTCTPCSLSNNGLPAGGRRD